MFVLKRNGKKQSMQFDKITSRIKIVMNEANITDIDPVTITQLLVQRMVTGIKTTEIDDLACQIIMGKVHEGQKYGKLASLLSISNYHKTTPNSFKEVVETLRNNKDPCGEIAPLVSDQLALFVEKYGNEIEDMIQYGRDYLIDYFGMSTLKKAYLLKKQGEYIERPQHLYMRVAIGIHGDISNPNFEEIKKIYDGLSLQRYTHATPTLFHAGTPRPQMASCFLIGTEDSVEGIYGTLTDCAKISKWAGGIGIHIHNIRGDGSYIRKTGGTSDGLMPMLRVYDSTARYINQCFTPDTNVYTKNGAKHICNVAVGDEVVTMDGSYKKVNEVIVNQKNEKIYSISVEDSILNTKCTGVHEIFALSGIEEITRTDDIISMLHNGEVQPGFVPANKLTSRTDFLVFPIPCDDFDDGTLTNDICRFYGIMLSDGHITQRDNPDAYDCEVTLADSKIDTLLFVKHFLHRNKIQFWESCGRNWIIIRWKHSDKVEFTYDTIYDNDKNKFVHPRFLNLPKEKLMFLLKGMMDTDYSTENELYYQTTSLTLMENLRFVFLKCGIITSGCAPDTDDNPSPYRSIINPKQSYMMRIPKKELLCDVLKIKASGQFNFFEYNGKIFSRIKHIKTIDYEGDVYDLNVEDNHNYLTHMGLVHNSGKRNGSFAMYLEPWHPDLIKFLHAKRAQGVEEERARDLFYALWIPDLFMERVRDNAIWSFMCPDLCPGLSDCYGDDFKRMYEDYEHKEKYSNQMPAREVWENIIVGQIESGVPYMLYKDACNKKSNQKNQGTIKSSNLCVSGGTYIITEQGSFQIRTLEGEELNVWNGFEFSNVVVTKTGKNQNVHRISFSNGEELFCTPYHKFYVKSDRTDSYEIIEVRADDLTENMKITKFNLPLLDNKMYIEDPFECGAMCYREKDKDIMVPFNCSVDTKIKWLSGYFSLDESCISYDYIGEQTLHTTSDNKGLLMHIKRLINMLGLHCEINTIPEYLEDIKYRLIVKSYELGKLIKLGFLSPKINIKTDKTIGNNMNCIYISSIDKNIRTEDTYCFTDEKRNMGVFNGIVTGNCAEIIQHSDAENPSVCNLASINLKSMLEFPPNPLSSLEIISKPDCFYCKLLKFTLQNRNIHYEEYHIEDEIAKELSSTFKPISYSTVPQVFGSIDKSHTKFIGGFWDIWEFLKPKIDYNLLRDTASEVTNNLNKVIDKSFYPLEGAKNTNFKHRPIGIGVQGLADVFAEMLVQFDSDYAMKVNKEIFETIYYGAMKESIKLAETHGPYESYHGSPLSEGKFQFNLWELDDNDLSGMWDWNEMRNELYKHGARNSLLTALMPTASTAQILGNNECFEPFTSNLYTRSTIAGEFTMVNNTLFKYLEGSNLWNKNLENQIMFNRGSVQKINEIPQEFRNVFKTVWEISQKKYIEMSAQRAPFIDQSQSLNLWFAEPTFQKLYKAHMLGWSLGLKTGSYYIRQLPPGNAQRLGMSASVEKRIEDGVCESCSA